MATHGIWNDFEQTVDALVQRHPDIPRDCLAAFEAASRRPLHERLKYAFIKTYKPVMDDAKFRAWDTTADYRKWCEENLPSWLGYGPAKPDSPHGV
jgi:hypothetical protein